MRVPLVLIILAAILITPSIPMHVSANPMTISYANLGSFFCFSSNISMPEASVNITLTCRDVIQNGSYGPTFIYEMEMQSSFVVQCADDQNTTIAFAYPASWEYYYSPVILDGIQFEVIVDDVEVPTQTIIPSEIYFNLDEISPEELIEWGFLGDNLFVLFDITLYAYTSATIEVNTNFTMSASTDIFDFDYCVGTARAWNGYTVEEVRIQLLNTTQYLGNSFQPQESLTVAEEVDRTTGVWNLNFSSFADDSVGVSISQKQWPYSTTTTVNTTGLPTLTQTMFLFVGVSAVVVLIILVIYAKRT